MKKNFSLLFVLLLVALQFATFQQLGNAEPNSSISHASLTTYRDTITYDQIQSEVSITTFPLASLFIENIGQLTENVQYQVRGNSYYMWLEKDAIWLTFLSTNPQVDGHSSESSDVRAFTNSINLKLSFVNSNVETSVEAINPLKTSMNYLVGNESEKWYSNAPLSEGVRYKDIYPNIDLELINEQNEIGFHLICKLNCQPSLAMIQIEIEGAENIIRKNEQFLASTQNGNFPIPSFSVINISGEPLEIPFPEPGIVSNNTITPFFKPYSIASEQPEDNPNDLIFATYLYGSSGGDFGSDIEVDAEGNAYITGWTWSADFPTTPGAFDTSFSTAPDGFILKVDPNGNIIYSTFIGGTGNDCSYKGCAIDIDENGNVFITGITTSVDFPITDGAFDTNNNGSFDAFVTKLNPSGNSILYSTYLGTDDGLDWGTKIAVDAVGNAYVVGVTDSINFPVTNGVFDETYNGGTDVFVTKLNSLGTGLIFSTFVGGGSDECPVSFDDIQGYDSCAIYLDETGNIYVTGSTLSNNFPVTSGVFDATYNGNQDGFIFKLNNIGENLLFSTFIGGSEIENATGIAVGSDESVYISGWTFSVDFPTTAGAFDTCQGTTLPCGSIISPDAFSIRLSADGTELIYSTYLGGDYRDYSHDIVLDSSGRPTILARTEWDDFPITPDAYDTSHNGHWDAVLVRLTPDGSQVEYSTFYGPGYEDFNYGHAIALSNIGHIYITGNAGYSQVIVARFAMGQTCEVPFFSQRDPSWINHPLQTNGGCSASCNTIGACGCTLTSATMLFAHYDAPLTPPQLSDSLTTSACPFNWLAAASNSFGQATWVNKYPFSWAKLDQELNVNQHPVLIGMHRSGKPNDTHWVLVTEGQGSEPADYLMHDPWFIGGANMKLSVRANQSYVFDWIAVYSGSSSACSNISVEHQPPSSQSIKSVVFNEISSDEVVLDSSNTLRSYNGADVNGSVFIYTMTELTMTLSLTATTTSIGGIVTEMQIWTDDNPNPAWQPFSPYASLPASDIVYVRYRDNLGVTSEIFTDSIFPTFSPPPETVAIFLPIVTRP